MSILHFYHDYRSALIYVYPLIEENLKKNINSNLVLYASLSNKKSFPNIIYINSFRTLNLFIILKSFYLTLKLIINKKPKVIFTHSFVSSFFPLLIAFICGVNKRVYFNHGIPYIGYEGVLKYLLKFIEHVNIILCTDIISVSPSQKKIFNKLTKKNVVNFNPGSACGLDNKWYKKINLLDLKKIKKKLNLDNKFVVLYVGRPKIRKGYIDAINSILNCNDTSIVLLLLGIKKSDIKSFAKYKNIIPLGYKFDTVKYYDISDVVFLPSHHEGFGYSLLEGASRGCALISSNIPGPDCICNKKNGFKVKKKNIKGFSKKICFLKNNKTNLNNMKTNSKRIAMKFSRKEILVQYSNFVDSLIK